MLTHANSGAKQVKVQVQRLHFPLLLYTPAVALQRNGVRDDTEMVSEQKKKKKIARGKKIHVLECNFPGVSILAFVIFFFFHILLLSLR